MLRLLVLTVCNIAYPSSLFITTIQTAACLVFLVWYVSKQPFGSRGPNNLGTFFLVSLTIMSALHIVQGTLCTLAIKVQGPIQAQIFITDWIELALKLALPVVLIVCGVVWILVKILYMESLVC